MTSMSTECTLSMATAVTQKLQTQQQSLPSQAAAQLLYQEHRQVTNGIKSHTTFQAELDQRGRVNQQQIAMLQQEMARLHHQMEFRRQQLIQKGTLAHHILEDRQKCVQYIAGLERTALKIEECIMKQGLPMPDISFSVTKPLAPQLPSPTQSYNALNNHGKIPATSRATPSSVAPLEVKAARRPKPLNLAVGSNVNVVGTQVMHLSPLQLPVWNRITVPNDRKRSHQVMAADDRPADSPLAKRTRWASESKLETSISKSSMSRRNPLIEVVIANGVAAAAPVDKKDPHMEDMRSQLDDEDFATFVSLTNEIKRIDSAEIETASTQTKSVFENGMVPASLCMESAVKAA